MNPSGSEFTLRVAICDLVERLKRMQHKCSYLEECRNQLVKEVIRLRLQNEWLAKQISDSPGASTSLPQNLQSICNNKQIIVNSQFNTQHCHLSGHETTSANESSNSAREVDLLCMNHKSDSSNKDESLHLMNILNQFEQEDLESNKADSIKHLTIRMLKDLETEMKTGRLKSDLITFVKNSSAQANGDLELNDDLMMKFDDELVDNHGTNSANYEAFNNNSDYYSNSHNLNIAFEDQMQMYAQNTNNKNYKDGDSLLDRSSSERRSKEDNKSTDLPKRINGLGEEDPINATEMQPPNANSSLLGSLDYALKDDELINIIVAVKDNLKDLHQGVLTSTDKLNKMKSRQLRYYFQKQINLENSAKNKLTNMSPQQLQQHNNNQNHNHFGNSTGNNSLK